jgi:all-trans-retinol dehydrogenase (NAD+)
MQSLTGKRVLITGGGRGLGRALAHRFAAAGGHVIVTDRDAAAAESVAGEVNGTALPLDVTDPAAILAVRNRVRPIDVLVNNAGVVFGGPFVDVPLDRHHLTVAVNLGGGLNVTHAFLADLVARPEAHVVNIASASAFIPLPWAASYAASKWAVVGFTESLRDELRLQGHRHVGVTAVCPSYITTGLFAGAAPPRLTTWLTPIGAADATVRAVLRGQGMVVLPWRVRMLLGVAGLLPWPLWRRAMALTGVSTSMTGWAGRRTDRPSEPEA